MNTSHPNYELFEELGRGEDTVVFRAHDIALGRDVAIKMLSESAAKDQARQQGFLKEAQFLAQSQHAGVLRIHTVEREQGWIVMELMEGSLASQIQQSALPAETVRSILRQLLPALDFLHSRGKLHAAIRPSNILIDKEGTVRLSDFEETNIEGELKAPDTSKKYLAPELLQPEFGKLGPQADLYCLGLSAFELLAGPRFDELILASSGGAIDPDIAWLRMHSSSQALPLVNDVLPKVPSDLATAIDGMLAKTVTERPESTEEVLKQLDDQALVRVEAIKTDQFASVIDSAMMPTAVRELEPRQATAQPQPKSTHAKVNTSRAKEPNKKGQPTAPLTTGRTGFKELIEKKVVLYPVCALILLAAFGIGLVLQQDENPELAGGPEVIKPDPVTSPPKIEDEVTDAGEDGPEKDPVEEPQDKEQETEGESEPEEIVETDPIGIVEANDEGVDGENEQPTEMEIADADVQPDPNPLEQDLVTEKDGDAAPEEELVQSELPKPEETIEPDPSVSELNAILTEFSSEVKIDTTELLKEFKGDPELVIDSGGFMESVRDVAIDPSGRWVAAAGGKVVRVWDINDGELRHTLRGDRKRTSYGDCNAIAFSPDGQYMLVGVGDYQQHGSIRVYRTDQLDDVDSLLSGTTAPTVALAFSRDGKWLISGNSVGEVSLWSWKDRKKVATRQVASPDKPILDELHFADDSQFVFGVASQGPFILNLPDLQRQSAADPIPSSMRAWMMDVLARQLRLPFSTTKDPRVMDLRLENASWASAGAGKAGGSNKFWVATWKARGSMQQPTIAEPLQVYDGHKWNVTAVDFAPERNLVVSADKFGEVHVWDANQGDLLHRFVPQGKSIYEAAFGEKDGRVAFGTTPYKPGVWSRNNFGDFDLLLDPMSRLLGEFSDQSGFTPREETTSQGNLELKATRDQGAENYTFTLLQNGIEAGRYDLTTGRNPTAMTFLAKGTLGCGQPVVVSDDEGLLAVWDSTTDELRRAFIGHNEMVTSISVSGNGKYLLSGSADRTIRIWSLENQRPTGTFDFKYEGTIVKKVIEGSSSAEAGVQPGDTILSFDGKSLTTIHDLMLEGKFEYKPGQTVTVELSRGGKSFQYEMKLIEGYDFEEPVLSIYIGDDDKWIIWSPKGYYDASPGADELIGWHINRGPRRSALYYPVQQFQKQLYRPDVINRILTGQGVEEAVIAANKLRDQEAVDFRSPSDLAEHFPPRIEFLNPTYNSSLNRSEVKFEAQITSANGLPIREVTLLVNGVPAKVFEPSTPRETEFAIEQSLTLVNGENELELIAANVESTARHSIRVYVTAETPSQQIDLNVLAVGVNQQEALNAQKFVETLGRQQGGLLYENVKSRVLAGAEATTTAVQDGLQWLVDETDEGDTAIIFLATNGIVDSSENFYLGTEDTQSDRPRATAVAWREFIKTLHLDLPRCKKIVFLDIDPAQNIDRTGTRNPLLDLAAPELATTFFSSNSLQSGDAGSSTGFLAAALAQVVTDPKADIEPIDPDSLLSNHEVSQSWSQRMKQLNEGKLFPIAFVPPAVKSKNVLQIQTR